MKQITLQRYTSHFKLNMFQVDFSADWLSFLGKLLTLKICAAFALMKPKLPWTMKTMFFNCCATRQLLSCKFLQIMAVLLHKSFMILFWGKHSWLNDESIPGSFVYMWYVSPVESSVESPFSDNNNSEHCERSLRCERLHFSSIQLRPVYLTYESFKWFR